MKILKPGKVEQRKFTCPACECEFEAGGSDKSYSLGYYVMCPCCNNKLWWSEGEPYEEPVQAKKTDTVQLVELLRKTDELPWPVTTQQIAEFLITNGVTFREA